MAVNLLDYDHDHLSVYCQTLGERGFRAAQLLRWIHQRGVADFGAMTDLARSLRSKLAEHAYVPAMQVLSRQAAADGTIKWLFDVGNGDAVEAVFIEDPGRGTLCVSSQAGCPMGCLFCATGNQGFSRNLTTAEIIGQLWHVEHDLRSQGIHSRFSDRDRAITNVVMMGMGEPLQNYRALIPALRLMLDDHAYGLSRRRVTVSTAGVIPKIDALAQDCPVALAVSLHAPNDALRSELMPLNRKYPLADLLDACQRYIQYAPRDFVTFEYCMLDGVNDQDRHANELVDLLRSRGRSWCKCNLIAFNPFAQSGLRASPPQRIEAFAHTLSAAGIVTTVRRTRGDDIAAACGQLAGEVQDRTHAEQRMQRRHLEFGQRCKVGSHAAAIRNASHAIPSHSIP